MNTMTPEELHLVIGVILTACGLVGAAVAYYYNSKAPDSSSAAKFTVDLVRTDCTCEDHHDRERRECPSYIEHPKPYVTQHLVPSPGRIVVVRERAEEKSLGGIYKPDETQQWESSSNPFAMIVGVGDTQINQYGGPPVTTDCQEGDKVILGALGMAAPLISDGKIDYVYVVGFESVVGRLELVCGACGHHERHFAHEIKCRKCGAGAAPELVPAPPSEIVLPTLDQVADISAERIRKAV